MTARPLNSTWWTLNIFACGIQTGRLYTYSLRKKNTRCLCYYRMHAKVAAYAARDAAYMDYGVRGDAHTRRIRARILQRTRRHASSSSNCILAAIATTQPGLNVAAFAPRLHVDYLILLLGNITFCQHSAEFAAMLNAAFTGAAGLTPPEHNHTARSVSTLPTASRCQAARRLAATRLCQPVCSICNPSCVWYAQPVYTGVYAAVPSAVQPSPAL